MHLAGRNVHSKSQKPQPRAAAPQLQKQRQKQRQHQPQEQRPDSFPESGLSNDWFVYRGLSLLLATVFALSVASLLLVVAGPISAFSFTAVGSAATFAGSESALIFTEARTLCSLAKSSFFSTCESEPSAFFSGAFTASVNS